MMNIRSLPVAVIGAGPVGLAAAAQLCLRNIPFLVFEAGPSVASNVLSWRHVRVFSPWKYNIDKAAAKLLNETSWIQPDDNALPTGEELYEQYFKPLYELPLVKPNVHLNTTVISIGRKDMDKMKTVGRENQPFVIQALKQDEVLQYEVRALIDATGTWNSPNPIGSGGVYAMGEVENHKKIFYGIPKVLDEHTSRYSNKSILVVGSGHSAINVILELDKLKDVYPDTTINWVLRKKNLQNVYGGQENDALEARGALGVKIKKLVDSARVNVFTPFHVEQIDNEDGRLIVLGSQHGKKYALPPMDEIICNTGSRPDFSFLREVRLSVDSSLESVAALAPLIDPNIHSCGTVRPHGEKELRHPEKDFYIAGSKSYGRAPTFLMATGYEQVRSIVAALDGDTEAALNVELELPETGVCTTDLHDSGCCTDSRVQQDTRAITKCC